MLKLNLTVLVSVFLLLYLAPYSQVLSHTIVQQPEEESSDLVEGGSKAVENVRSKYTLPKLFDFERFKRVFKRAYGSILEELARKRLYLARAFKAFLSAVGYKHGNRSSYLAINSMSDWTPAEIKRMYVNGDMILKKLSEKFGIRTDEDHSKAPANKISGDEVIPAIDENEIEENFEKCAENPDEPGNKEILEELESVNSRRKKRSAAKPKRNLDLDDLFREPESTESQMSDRVPSNNPEYVPPELRSYGGEDNSGILSYMPRSLAKMIIATPGVSFAANVFRTVSSNFLGAPNAPTKNPPNQLVKNKEQQADWQEMLTNQPTPMQIRQQEALKKYEQDYNRQQHVNNGKCARKHSSVRNHQQPTFNHQPSVRQQQQSFRHQQQQSFNRQPSIRQQQPSPLMNQQNPFLQQQSFRQTPGLAVDLTPSPNSSFQKFDPLSLPIEKLPDKVFTDHRESNCLLEVRRQHGCGACYAFATIALFEWTYCKQTGNRVALSEQYVVDCGKTVGLEGCEGGVFTTVSEFVDTFGLELRSNYPYRHKEDECPYEEEQIKNHTQSMGYLRVGEQNFKHVKLSEVEETLKERPMVVNVAYADSFNEYGGGVAEEIDCDDSNMHSMLLIGSGREDGKEYWLIRNSHGIDWGEQGYYKVSKKFNCIKPRFGFMLVANFDSDITKNMNDKYDMQRIKRRYWDYMKSDIEASEKRARLS